MPGRRCSDCNINWPGNEPGYDICASCLGKTWYGAQLEPDDDPATARQNQRRFQFEREYERRGEREYVPETAQRAKEWGQQLAYCDALMERDRILIDLRDADTVPHPAES